MSYSLFDLFKVSIGPSSSHTAAPMLACHKFTQYLAKTGLLHSVEFISVELFGSLALNGKQLKTDQACIVGLSSAHVDNITVDEMAQIVASVQKRNVIALNEQRHIVFKPHEHIQFLTNKSMPEHTNAMRITAKNAKDYVVMSKIYYCLNGGLVLEKGKQDALEDIALPYPFSSGAELIERCEKERKTIAELVFANELARLKAKNKQATLQDVYKKIDELWLIMKETIAQGIDHKEALPGGLNLKRRAPYLHEAIKKKKLENKVIENEEWVNLFSISIAEENAAGGRVITGPGNGAAGVIPAVLSYYNKFINNNDTQGIRTFLATAAAIGALYKTNASTAAVQVGCQGEIGVACSMAAAGLTAARGGTLAQIENAAEIAMEHNLGLPCDPISGLIQIPCIERNCMGAIKAINATRLALSSDGEHHISLDDVIMMMNDTGLNMMTRYKESSSVVSGDNNIPINIIVC
ncbi:MAG: L-serine ammonia-lyase [Vibrionaceae bacterium]